MYASSLHTFVHLLGKWGGDFHSFPFLSFPFEALHEDNGVRMYVVYTVVSYYYSTESSNVTVSGTHTHSAILIAMVAPIIVIPCCCCWLLLRDLPSPSFPLLGFVSYRSSSRHSQNPHSRCGAASPCALCCSWRPAVSVAVSPA
jgi:hypothetical protein